MEEIKTWPLEEEKEEKEETDLDSPAIPRAVRNVLLYNEHKVLYTHYHWAILLGQATLFFGWLFACVIVHIELFMHHQAYPHYVMALWLSFVSICIWYAKETIEFYGTYIIVTNKNIISVFSLVARRITPLPLRMLRDCEMQQSILGRWLGYGTIYTQSFATDHMLREIHFIPDPDRVYKVIRQQWFSVRKDGPANIDLF